MKTKQGLGKMVCSFLIGTLLFQSTVASADVNRTREEVAEGLIAAEGCLAVTAALIILARNPGVVEKIAKLGLKADEKIEKLAAALGIGEHTAAFLIRSFELGLVAKGTGELFKAYFRMCKRGAEEVVIAFADAPGAAGTVIFGADTGGAQERKLPQASPIRVARDCWDNASRGLFTSKRESAIECCAKKFGNGTNDFVACRNNVNTLNDISGW